MMYSFISAIDYARRDDSALISTPRITFLICKEEYYILLYMPSSGVPQVREASKRYRQSASAGISCCARDCIAAFYILRYISPPVSPTTPLLRGPRGRCRCRKAFDKSHDADFSRRLPAKPFYNAARFRLSSCLFERR